MINIPQGESADDYDNEVIVLEGFTDDLRRSAIEQSEKGECVLMTPKLALLLADFIDQKRNAIPLAAA